MITGIKSISHYDQNRQKKRDDSNEDEDDVKVKVKPKLGSGMTISHSQPFDPRDIEMLKVD